MISNTQSQGQTAEGHYLYTRVMQVMKKATPTVKR